MAAGGSDPGSKESREDRFGRIWGYLFVGFMVLLTVTLVGIALFSEG